MNTYAPNSTFQTNSNAFTIGTTLLVYNNKTSMKSHFCHLLKAMHDIQYNAPLLLAQSLLYLSLTFTVFINKKTTENCSLFHGETHENA